MLVDPPERLLEEWRPGVMTSFRAGASTGARTLCVIEQWCDPGTGAPMHTHPNAEEVIVVLEGIGEFSVDEERAVLGPGRSIVVPEGSRHGFVTVGAAVLHICAVFSAAAPTVVYEDDPGTAFEIRREVGTSRVPRSAHGRER